jgi:[ribosomal protein S5]-alanine N-acetyltransferase
MFEMDCNNPNVHKYLMAKTQLFKLTNHKDYIEMVENNTSITELDVLWLLLKIQNELIGWTGIKFVNDHVENGNTNFYDYGYRLNEKFWNKGFATEASIAWLELWFQSNENSQK